MIEVPAGHRWDAPRAAEQWRRQLGLLVLDGLLTRDVVLVGSACTELIGEGDLLRPWDHVRADPVPFEVEWEVLATTRLAVLDRRVTALVGRLGEVSTALISRSVRRSRWLGLHLAIRCLRRVDARLLVLFWHLAERWGRVTPGGVVVSLPLTHELLARLIGAQRPSVTTALGELATRGAVLGKSSDGSSAETFPRARAHLRRTPCAASQLGGWDLRGRRARTRVALAAEYSPA